MRALQRRRGVGCHGERLLRVRSGWELRYRSLVELLEGLPLLLAVDFLEAFRFAVDLFLLLARCALLLFQHALHAFRLGVVGASAFALFGFDCFAQARGFEIEFPLGAGVGWWRAGGAGGCGGGGGGEGGVAVASGWEGGVGGVAERGGGGVVVGAGESGRGFGDVEGFADRVAEDLADYNRAEEEDYFETF